MKLSRKWLASGAVISVVALGLGCQPSTFGDRHGTPSRRATGGSGQAGLPSSRGREAGLDPNAYPPENPRPGVSGKAGKAKAHPDAGMKMDADGGM